MNGFLESRCPVCGRLLFQLRGRVDEVRIKCKCGRIVVVKGTEASIAA